MSDKDNSNKYLIIAIVEALIICFMVWYFIIDTPEKVDLSKFNEMEAKYDIEHKLRLEFQEKNQKQNDSLSLVNTNEIDSINKIENVKATNSKELNDRVSVIRNTHLDSVAYIFARQPGNKPEGY